MLLVRPEQIFLMTFLVSALAELAHRARARKPAAPALEATMEIEALGLLWDVNLDIFRYERPASRTSLANYLVRGPYCTVCKNLLQTTALDGQESRIVNPCPVCANAHRVANESGVFGAKLDVYDRLVQALGPAKH